MEERSRSKPTQDDKEQQWEAIVTDVLGRVMAVPGMADDLGICLYVAAEGADDQRSTFHWFQRRDDLLDYVRHVLPYNARRLYPDDAHKRHEQTLYYVEEMEHRRLNAAEAAEVISGVLEGYCSIEWWGRYLDLLAGDGPFERDLRLWFRERNADQEHVEIAWGDTPIADEERDAFREMLQVYR
jgi:hypothetical protein